MKRSSSSSSRSSSSSSSSSVFTNSKPHQAVVKRCSTHNGITWGLSSLFDALKTNLLTAPELAVRQLQGKGLPGGKGILDLFLGKQDAAVALHKFAADADFTQSLVARLEKWKVSIDNYRADVGFWDHTKKAYTVNNQWMVALTPANQGLLKVWEEVVVLPEYDQSIKQCKIAGLTIQEGFLAKQPMKDRLEALHELLIEENGGRPAASTDKTCKLADVCDDDTDDDQAKKSISQTPSPAKLLEGGESELRKWADYARQKVSRGVKLVVHPLTCDGVACAFQDSALSYMEYGENKHGQKFLAIMYDQKFSGSPSSRPHLRSVPLREQHCKSGLKGVVDGMNGHDGGEIPKNAVFFVFDGQVHGNELKLMRALADNTGKALNKEKRTVFVTTTEASLRKRRQRVRGAVPITCVEFLHIVTGKLVTLPEKDRLNMPGTTQSDFLGPFDVPDNESVWRVPSKQKTAIYGSAMVDVGGSIPGDDPAADPAPKPSEMTPLTFGTNSDKLYEELDHLANCAGWVDLTCLDEKLAMLCIRNQKPYLGYCPTELHMTLLRERIEEKVFEAFQTTGDKLYEVQFADVMKRSGSEGQAKATVPAGGGTSGAASGSGNGASAGGGEAPGAGGEGQAGTGRGRGRGGSGAKGAEGAAGAAGSKVDLLATLKALETGEAPP